MSKKKPEGIFIPMVTPFNASDESIDFSGLKEVTDFLIENGVDGLIPSGSTGEFIAMTPEEQKKVNAAVCEYAGGRSKVYCSTGAYRTADVIDMSQSAEAAGADGVMIVTPVVHGPQRRRTLQSFQSHPQSCQYTGHDVP